MDCTVPPLWAAQGWRLPGCKTSREAIVGLYKAVQQYLGQDEAAELRRLNARCARFERTLRECGFTRIMRTQEGPVGQQMPRTYGVMPLWKRRKTGRKNAGRGNLHWGRAGQSDFAQSPDGRPLPGKNGL